MWRNRSILLCRAGATRDGNVDRIGREILDGFRANGWKAVDQLLPPANPGSMLTETVARIEGGEFDLVLSIQDLGMFGGAELGAILMRGGARRLYWALDHPYSCWQTVMSLPAGAIVTYPTRGNLEFFRRHLRSDLATACLAHGAIPRDPKPWGRRTVGVLFVGNAPTVAPERMRRDWPQHYPPLWAGLLDEMAVRFDPYRSDSLEGLAEAALAGRGVNPGTIARSDLMLLLSLFDGYARATTRLAYISALKGTNLTLAGRGWEAIAGDGLRTLGPLPADQVRDVVGNARLVLNILPAWYRSHERVFEGMAAGSAIVTTGRGPIANACDVDSDPADERAIVQIGPPADAKDQLAELMGNESSLRALAEAGLEEHRARHTWAHRVKALLAAAENRD